MGTFLGQFVIPWGHFGAVLSHMDVLGPFYPMGAFWGQLITPKGHFGTNLLPQRDILGPIYPVGTFWGRPMPEGFGGREEEGLEGAPARK